MLQCNTVMQLPALTAESGERGKGGTRVTCGMQSISFHRSIMTKG